MPIKCPPAQVFFEYTQVSSFFLAITLVLGYFLAKHFIGPLLGYYLAIREILGGDLCFFSPVNSDKNKRFQIYFPWVLRDLPPR